MNHLTVKARLVLTLGSMAALMIVIAITSLVSLNSARERLHGMVHGVQARFQMASDLRSAVSLRAISARNLVLLQDPVALQDEKAAVTQANEAVGTALRQLKAAVSDEAVPQAIRDKVAAIDAVEARYGPIATNIVQMASGGQHEQAVTQMNTDCRPALKELLAAIADYMTLSSEHARHVTEVAEADYASQRLVLLLTCLVALVGAGGLGWTVVRSLTSALGAEPRDLNGAVLRVASGDLKPVEGAHSAPPSSILAAVGRMQQDLSGLVAQVRSTSESIAADPDRHGQRRPVATHRGAGVEPAANLRFDAGDPRHRAAQRRHRAPGLAIGQLGQPGRAAGW